MKVKPAHNHKTGMRNGNIYFKDPATGKQVELATLTQHQRNQVICQFNGDFENPTISPAILILDGKDVTGDSTADITKALHVNHFVIQSGQIRYFEDSNHIFRGKTIPLPDF
jgi:hypothetical protein